MRNSSLPQKSEPFEAITTLQFTVFRHAVYIIRLPDGRFLIIDSHLNRAHLVDGIYEELCRQNVLEGKPVIAAWMFTHAHSDHVGGFIGLMEKYGDKVEIQSIIHNFPGEETYFGKNYLEYSMDNVSNGMTSLMRRMKELMDEKLTGNRCIVAHTGQTFEYPDIKVEIIFTSENLYDQQIILLSLIRCDNTIIPRSTAFANVGEWIFAESLHMVNGFGKWKVYGDLRF